MACAISIVIALVGFISMKSLSIEQYPNIAPPQVMVITSYTGADANTIMKSVIQPLEESINGVPGMTYMTSKSSSTGDVSISVFFKQGTDPDMAAVNVQNRVSLAQALLPADVTTSCVSSPLRAWTGNMTKISYRTMSTSISNLVYSVSLVLAP